MTDDEVDYGNPETSDSNEPEAEKPDENHRDKYAHQDEYSYSPYSDSCEEVDLRSNTRLTENDQAHVEADLRSWFDQSCWKKATKGRWTNTFYPGGNQNSCIRSMDISL